MLVRILSDVAVSPNGAAGDGGTTCAFVQAARAACGDVYCLYRRGAQKHGPDGVLMLQRSSDGGRTWQTPCVVFDRTDRAPPETVICGGLCAVGDELLATFCSLEMLDPNAYVFGDAARAFPRHINVSRSDDRGRTWSAPSRIEVPSFAARSGVASSPFLLADGDLCAPLEVQLPSGPQATAACFSSDGGRSFSRPEIVASDDEGRLSLCDARFARLGDGTYLAHLWAFRHDTEETAAPYESRSADGRAWSRPTPTTLAGQISQPLELPSGLLIAVCNHRQVPTGSQLWWSADRGRTWNDRPVQMWDVAEGRVTGAPARKRAAADKEDVWEALPRFSFGTPNLISLPDETVLLIYWAAPGGVTHIRACRFRIAPERPG